jgi:hypothetical protein
VRVRPDDEVYRINTVWLGPRGLTFPWTARYLAYGVWLITFLGVLFVEAVTPLSIGVPPVWEICLTTLFTYAVMGLVDHERPVVSVFQTLRSEVNAPRADKGKAIQVGPRRFKVVSERPARSRRGRGAPRRARRTSRFARAARAPKTVRTRTAGGPPVIKPAVVKHPVRDPAVRAGTVRRPQAPAQPARPAQPPVRQQPISGRLLPNAKQRPATLPGQREADARQVAQPTDEHFTNPRGTS